MNLKILQYLAIFEGISYLLILFVTMPLKYLFDMPQFTFPVGITHGVLFVAYCIWVLIVGMKYKWSMKIILLSLLASLIPFATFYAERKWFKA